MPGIQKTVGGVSPLRDFWETQGDRFGTSYQGTVRTDEVVNWKIRVFNDADKDGNILKDYTLIDTVDAPYAFTGRCIYEIFDHTGRRISSDRPEYGTTELFSFKRRTPDDTEVNWTFGQTYPSDYNSRYQLGTERVFGRLVDSALYSDYPELYPEHVLNRGTVRIDRDDSGKETLTLHLFTDDTAIPAGGYAEFSISTMYNSSAYVLNENYFNDVILKPADMSYDADLVSNGKTLFDDEGNNAGVESGALVTVAMGYSTTAVKKITEIGNTENTARSDDEAHNWIALSRKDKTFWYDCLVNTPEEANAPFAKLVICDALPYVGDHAAFDERDIRDSKFKVSFLDSDLGFYASTITDKGNGTETEIPSEYLKLYLNEKYEFTDEDWKGAGEGWVEFPGDLSEAELMSAPVPADVIGEENAREIACNHAAVKPAEVLQAEVELRSGPDGEFYAVEFRTASRRFSYEIDAHTGEIFASRTWTSCNCWNKQW